MPEVTRYSNMAEMFYLSADSIDLHNQYAYGVLAHEFQHMIHWNVDRNETTWVNEGLSELAVDLNGLENGGFSYYFSFNPDLQLNFWPGHDQGDSIPHYGASYLFLKYLYDRFGQDFISEVVAEKANGWQGIENVLRKHHEENNFPAASHEQIFQDWTLANLLNGEETANNAYVYSDNDSVPFFGADTEIDCNDSSLVSSVEQFGTDYISVSCDDDYEVEIKWEEQVPLLPEKPYSGDNYYWSNRGSESVMRLAREFDLTGISSPIELSYWIWYDIEKDYDYMNVNISDDGKQWKMLEPPSCTRDDPTGANFGCGYNGTSDGWVQEKINLSEFSGKHVVIEFEYITDASVNGEGILLDDVSIDAIDYFDDFENNNGEWDADGFVRVENSLPQVLAFSMIEQDQEIDVSKYIVEPGDDGFHFVENSDPEDDEIIAISGLTRYTRLPAQYEVIITKSNS